MIELPIWLFVVLIVMASPLAFIALAWVIFSIFLLISYFIGLVMPDDEGEGK